MHFKNSFAAAVAAAVTAVVVSLAMQPAEAGLVVYGEQVGSGVVLIGTGSFNTVTLASSGTFLSPANLTVDAGLAARAIYYTDLVGDEVAFKRYTGALLAGSADIASALGSTQLTATALSGDKFAFSRSATSSGYQLRLEPTYTSNAPLSMSVTLPNTFLDTTLGWSTAGTWASPVQNSSFTLANGETVQFVSVPEPTQMVSVAGIGAAYGAWRLRKLRRSRMTAGDATAG